MQNPSPSRSHLQFNIDARPEIIDAKKGWETNPNDYRLDNLNLLNDSHKYLKSASEWTIAHTEAFHIVPILDLEIEDVLPKEFLPNDSELKDFHLFWCMERDDIYDQNWHKFLEKSQ